MQIFDKEAKDLEREVCFIDIASDEIPERYYKESEVRGNLAVNIETKTILFLYKILLVSDISRAFVQRGSSQQPLCPGCPTLSFADDSLKCFPTLSEHTLNQTFDIQLN